MIKKLPPTAPRACAETPVIVFQLCQSWVSSLAPRVDTPPPPLMVHSFFPQKLRSKATRLSVISHHGGHDRRSERHLNQPESRVSHLIAAPPGKLQETSRNGPLTATSSAQVDDARLKLAGAFDSHVSPVTQCFCSFGSKSNL